MILKIENYTSDTIQRKEIKIMEKQTVIFTESVPKKHSVRFSNKLKESAVSDIYIKRSAFGANVPKKIKVTIEEVG